MVWYYSECEWVMVVYAVDELQEIIESILYSYQVYQDEQ